MRRGSGWLEDGEEAVSCGDIQVGLCVTVEAEGTDEGKRNVDALEALGALV